jgi:hypothetical protein
MAKKTVGALNVKLTATTASFSKAMRRATVRVKTLGKNIARIASRVAKWGAAMGAVAMGAVALFVRQSFKMIDSLHKAAGKMGITTEALAGLRHGATIAGMETEKFDKSLQKMLQSIGEVQMGVGEAKEAFKRMGLPIEKLVAMKPEEQFLAITRALKGVASNTEKIAYAADIFGARMGVAILNMDPVEFAKAAAEAHKFGAALSQVDATMVAHANDAITRMKLSLRGVANVIAVRVAPFVTDMAHKVAEWGVHGRAAARKIFDGLKTIVTAGAKILDLWRNLKIAWLGVKTIILKGVSAILDAVDSMVQGLIKAINKIPKVHVEFGKSLTELSEGMALVVKENEAQISRMLRQPLPSEKLKAWFKNIPKAARSAAAGIPEMLRRMPIMVGVESVAKKVAEQVTRAQIGFRTARQLGAGYGAPVAMQLSGGNLELKESRRQTELLERANRTLEDIRREGGLQ